MFSPSTPLINCGTCTSFHLALISNVSWKAFSFSLVTCSNWNSFCVLASVTALQASAVPFLSSLLICPCSIQQIIAFCISDLKNRLCFTDGSLLWFCYLSFHQHGYLYALPLMLPHLLLIKKCPELFSTTFLWVSVNRIVPSNMLSSIMHLFYPSLNSVPSFLPLT